MWLLLFLAAHGAYRKLPRVHLCTYLTLEIDTWLVNEQVHNLTLCYCRDGENHRSLAQLLKDLEKRVQGNEPSAGAVGATLSRPLHVVLQVRASSRRALP